MNRREKLKERSVRALEFDSRQRPQATGSAGLQVITGRQEVRVPSFAPNLSASKEDRDNLSKIMSLTGNLGERWHRRTVKRDTIQGKADKVSGKERPEKQSRAYLESFDTQSAKQDFTVLSGQLIDLRANRSKMTEDEFTMAREDLLTKAFEGKSTVYTSVLGSDVMQFEVEQEYRRKQGLIANSEEDEMLLSAHTKVMETSNDALADRRKMMGMGSSALLQAETVVAGIPLDSNYNANVTTAVLAERQVLESNLPEGEQSLATLARFDRDTTAMLNKASMHQVKEDLIEANTHLIADVKSETLAPLNDALQSALGFNIIEMTKGDGSQLEQAQQWFADNPEASQKLGTDFTSFNKHYAKEAGMSLDEASKVTIPALVDHLAQAGLENAIFGLKFDDPRDQQYLVDAQLKARGSYETAKTFQETQQEMSDANERKTINKELQGKFGEIQSASSPEERAELVSEFKEIQERGAKHLTISEQRANYSAVTNPSDTTAMLLDARSGVTPQQFTDTWGQHILNMSDSARKQYFDVLSHLESGQFSHQSANLTTFRDNLMHSYRDGVEGVEGLTETIGIQLESIGNSATASLMKGEEFDWGKAQLDLHNTVISALKNDVDKHGKNFFQRRRDNGLPDIELQGTDEQEVVDTSELLNGANQQILDGSVTRDEVIESIDNDETLTDEQKVELLQNLADEPDDEELSLTAVERERVDFEERRARLAELQERLSDPKIALTTEEYKERTQLKRSLWFAESKLEAKEFEAWLEENGHTISKGRTGSRERTKLKAQFKRENSKA